MPFNAPTLTLPPSISTTPRLPSEPVQMSRPDRLAGADLGETAAGAGAGTAAKAVLEAGLETVDTVTGFFREGEAGPAKEGEPTPGDEIEAGVAITSADGGKTEIPAAAP